MAKKNSFILFFSIHELLLWLLVLLLLQGGIIKPFIIRLLFIGSLLGATLLLPFFLIFVLLFLFYRKNYIVPVLSCCALFRFLLLHRETSTKTHAAADVPLLPKGTNAARIDPHCPAPAVAFHERCARNKSIAYYYYYSTNRWVSPHHESFPR